MASRIEHHAEFTDGVAEVLAALTDKDALLARLERLGGKHAALQEHEPGADRVHYRLIQGIAAEQLPPAVHSLHKGDLIVHREQTWQRASRGYTGTARATVNGVPGEIEATTELTGSPAGAVLSTTGEAKVRIPLVGGKLEAVIAEQVTKLLEREAEFTVGWLAGS